MQPAILLSGVTTPLPPLFLNSDDLPKKCCVGFARKKCTDYRTIYTRRNQLLQIRLYQQFEKDKVKKEGPITKGYSNHAGTPPLLHILLSPRARKQELPNLFFSCICIGGLQMGRKKLIWKYAILDISSLSKFIPIAP